MKKILFPFLTLCLLAFSLCACVEEYPEPLFVPEDISSEERVAIRTETHADIVYQLYNDRTCVLLGPESNKNLSSTALVLPASLSGGYRLIEIADGAFANTAYVSVTIPDTVTKIGARVFQKSAITEIILPDSVKEIGEECFDNCLNLENAVLSKSIKKLPYAAFFSCSSLEELTVPEGVVEIEEEALANLTSLKAITLPDSLKSIGNYAFWNSGTEELTFSLPKGLEEVGADAFWETPWLKTQTEEFVVVGQGVLLLYNGTETNVTLPKSVRYLSSAFARNCPDTLTLPPTLEGICENPFGDSTPPSITYTGDNEAIQEFLHSL